MPSADATVLEACGWTDLAGNKEAPHSCGAGECATIEKRGALPNDVPFTPPQECGGSLNEAVEQEILTRLVALNHTRAAEEKKGLIRYLRPDYQNSGSTPPPPDPHFGSDEEMLAWCESEKITPVKNKQGHWDWPAVWETFAARTEESPSLPGTETPKAATPKSTTATLAWPATLSA